MERRLSVALTVAGVVGAVAWMGLGGRRTVPTAQLDAAVTDLDMAARETAAGVQARAVTLAQLPRLAWAVATDEATVRDLTTEELAFRPQAGEQIEIAQIEGKDKRVRRLIGIPAHAASALVLSEPGLHLVVVGNEVYVTVVVRIEPKQRGKIVAGLLALAQRLDTSLMAAALGSRGIGARLQTRSGSVVLSRLPTGGNIRIVEMPLRSPAADGAKLLLSAPVGIAWGHVTGAILLLLASVAAGRLLGRRAGRVVVPQPPISAARSDLHEGVGQSAEAASQSQDAQDDSAGGEAFQGDEPTAVRSTGAVPSTSNGHVGTPQSTLRPDRHATPPAPPSAATGFSNGHRPHAPVVGAEAGANLSVSGAHLPPPGVVLSKPGALGVSGIVFAHGISMTMPSALFTGAPGSEAPPAPPRPGEEALASEYRRLFSEFVKLRRTCGQTTEDLNRDRFVAVLLHKRVELMERHGATEVKFRLAFDNGKAAVRFRTTT